MKLGKDFNLSQIQYKREEHGELAALFDCGNKGLNDYLTRDFIHEDPIFIFVDEDAQKIVAFVSMMCSSLIHTKSGNDFQIPAIEIKVFAVDQSYQNLRYSENDKDGVLSDKIMKRIINDIYDISQNTMNADFITLYSVEDAKKFYKRNGFTEYGKEMSQFHNNFNQTCLAMYMEL